MEYRINRRTGDRIGVLGLGTVSLSDAGCKEGVRTLTLAAEHGVNFFDLASAQADCFPYFGQAFAGMREQVLYQIHFGADYTTGSYGWTTDLDTVRRSIDRQLSELKTDYIDYGFLHCLDEPGDWEAYQKNGVLDYVLGLKKQGVVRHIGLSSHTPETIQLILDTGLVDLLMFSINPAYDYQQGEYARGSADARSALYRRCEAEGIGISVMKPFSGGQLLQAETSPFGKALTEYQCIRYALDKPGVLTVLPGVRGEEDLKRLLGYFDATPEELDYSVIGSFTPADSAGKCVYCNHCQPCPAALDIALINKYYDLTRAGDALAADHYRNLEKNAGDCIACGHCDRRCPFGVAQSERMKEIDGFFKERESK